MLIVKKFGGTSVANKERIFNVASRCIEEYRKGNDVVVVLSAMGKYTDELITMARDVNEKPPKREMDMLLSAGEQISISLLAMAIESLGFPVGRTENAKRRSNCGKRKGSSRTEKEIFRS